MYPILFQIYGPIYLRSFSILLGAALGVFIWQTLKDQRLARSISRNLFLNLTIESTIAGIIGGRLLFVLSDQYTYASLLDVISIWNGGLSIIGSVLSALFYAFWFCKKNRIDGMAVLDRVVIYAPLIHAIARLGCFCAGCCFGTSCNHWWAITYTHLDCAAPLHVALHPSQLYSSLSYLLIFILMYHFFKRSYTPKGIALCAYMFLSATERFSVDFFRGDRVMLQTKLPILKLLSVYQAMALCIIIISCATALILYRRNNAEIRV